ncbi:MAG: divalent-cation tolerance protein CutA [Thermoplasmata archaeon]
MSPYPMDPTEAVGPMRLVLTALPDEPTARRISRGALDLRLAACVNRWPIASAYWWKGQIEDAIEVIALFKTTPKRVGALVEYLGQEHPYDVPEIVELDVGRVHPPYLTYLVSVLGTDGHPLSRPRSPKSSQRPRRSVGP